MSLSVAIIGAGHMGACLLSGLLSGGLDKSQVILTDPKQSRLNDIRRRLGVEVSTDNAQALSSDVIICALRPQDMAPALKRLPSTKGVFVSLAAGRPLASLSPLIEGHLVRAMPNLPVVVGAGLTALVSDKQTPQKVKDMVESVFRLAGEALWLSNESELHAFTALCASAPALVMHVEKAFESCAQSYGFQPASARFLIRQMLFGTSKLILSQESATEALIQSIAVRGGVTEAMLEGLDASQLKSILYASIQKGVKKSEHLSH